MKPSRSDVIIIAAAFIVVAAYALVADGGFPLDDSWIHQTYARNLAERGEWSFVPGVPSAGSTAPLWTALLALGYVLGVHYTLWTYGLGALCLAAMGLLGARVVVCIFPDAEQVGLPTGLAIVIEWHLVWAAASGMETALFGALSMALVYLILRPRRRFVLGLVGGLLTLTRPEGLGLVGLALLFVYQEQLRGWAVDAAHIVAGWLVGVAPGALLNLSLNGSVLPNTAAAKQTEYAALLAAPYPARLFDVALPLLAGVLVLLLPGIVWGAWRRRQFRAYIALLWPLALVALYAARLPVQYQHGRYVVPALPHLIVWGVGGTLLMLRAGRRTMAGRLFSRALAIAAALLLLLFWPNGLQAYMHDVSVIRGGMVTTARYVAENIPPDALLAVHDIGAVGYFAPRDILDLAGLVTPEVIPFIRDEAKLMAYMEEHDAAYLMTFPNWYPEIVADPRVELVYPSSGIAPEDGWVRMAVYRLNWEGE